MFNLEEFLSSEDSLLREFAFTLNLDLFDAQLLANSLTSIQQQVDLALNSFSVSYNPGIETGGAQALLSSLPKSVN